MAERLTAVDLFAGAGGLSYGFRAEGFDVRLALDSDPWSAKTYTQNQSSTAYICRPIQTVPPHELLERTEVRPGALTILMGGPPCQDFSINNHQRGQDSRRAGLVQHYLRLVATFRPRFVLMENVTGMMSASGGFWVDAIYGSLGALGYRTEHRILSSQYYGVPQRRRRVFFAGSRDREDIGWPDPTHDPDGLEHFVTVGAAIGDLPCLEIGGGAEQMAYDSVPRSRYQRSMREGSNCLYNHVAPSLGTRNQERIRHIPPGGSWRNIPYDLLPPGMQRANRKDHTKRYGRLHSRDLASTILTKCDPHWGAYIHPSQDRTITVREAARLQSFPDTYRFHGPRGAQSRQVGNAVPPLVARGLARSLAKST